MIVAVRETVHAEAQVRDLCEALDAAEALLRQLDRMTAHYRLGWQMGAPFVEYDDGPIDPAYARPPRLRLTDSIRPARSGRGA